MNLSRSACIISLCSFLLSVPIWLLNEHPASGAGNADDWGIQADRLYSEDPEVRNAAQRILKSTGSLNEQLKKALQPDSPRLTQALDVIHVLGKKEFVPDLIGLLKARPQIDAVITLASFAGNAGDKSDKEIEVALQDAIEHSEDAGVLVAALDSCREKGFRISEKRLARLLHSTSYEVRGSAVRLAAKYEMKKVLAEALGVSPYQVRLIAAQSLARLQGTSQWMIKCAADRNEQVAKQCKGANP